MQILPIHKQILAIAFSLLNQRFLRRLQALLLFKLHAGALEKCANIVRTNAIQERAGYKK